MEVKYKKNILLESQPQLFDHNIHKIEQIPDSIDDQSDILSTLKNVTQTFKEIHDESNNINNTQDTFFDEAEYKFSVDKQLSKFQVKLQGYDINIPICVSCGIKKIQWEDPNKS